MTTFALTKGNKSMKLFAPAVSMLLLVSIAASSLRSAEPASDSIQIVATGTIGSTKSLSPTYVLQSSNLVLDVIGRNDATQKLVAAHKGKRVQVTGTLQRKQSDEIEMIIVADTVKEIK